MTETEGERQRDIEGTGEKERENGREGEGERDLAEAGAVHGRSVDGDGARQPVSHAPVARVLFRVRPLLGESE